jgi:hypothetical protein
MYAIKITAEKLRELRMLADWQLKQMGIDPASVTAAQLSADEEEEEEFDDPGENRTFLDD